MSCILKFKGESIFRFSRDENMQIIGSNIDLKNLIVDLLKRLANKYRFKQVDMEAMDNQYPYIELNGEESLVKPNFLVVDNLLDIVEHLSKNKNSLLEKNILKLENKLEVAKLLELLEDEFLRFIYSFENIINDLLGLRESQIDLSLKKFSLKEIYNKFMDLNYLQNKIHKPLWLMEEKTIVDIFFRLLELVDEEYIIVLRNLDVNLQGYKSFLEEILDISRRNLNLKIWNMPSLDQGIILEDYYFDKTVVLGRDEIYLENFDLTYESICRNYPSNKYPEREQVLEAILYGLNRDFFKEKYPKTANNLIFSIFMKLNDIDIKFEKLIDLDKMEENYLKNYI